jgi:hypothetical protein
MRALTPTLAALVLATTFAVTGPAAADHNCSSATTVSTGLRSGHIAGPGDVNHYRIWVSAGHAVRVDAVRTSAAGDLWLHRISPTCLSGSSSGMNPAASTSDTSVDADGYQYFAVRGGSSGGDYRLLVVEV